MVHCVLGEVVVVSYPVGPLLRGLLGSQRGGGSKLPSAFSVAWRGVIGTIEAPVVLVRLAACVTYSLRHQTNHCRFPRPETVDLSLSFPFRKHSAFP